MILDRMAWGTQTQRWHVVGPTDRDYETAITPKEFVRLGPARAKDQYLNPHRVPALTGEGRI